MEYTYTFSPEERRRLDAFAAEIIKKHKEKGTSSKRISTRQSELEIQRLGAYGEYAASMIFGVPFNWSTKKDTGHDIVIRGRTVQVKTYDRQYLREGNWLTMPYEDGFTADLAIQVLLPELGPMATLVGWVSRKRFLKHRTMPTWPGFKVKTKALPPQFMAPMETLLPTLERYPVVQAIPAKTEGPRALDVLDALVPPQHRGRTWDHASADGVVDGRFPPMDDPAFEDFRAYAHEVKREQHPEYYCVECRAVYVTAVCLHCQSARVAPTGQPRTTQGTLYRCSECGKDSRQALICGLCRTKLGPLAAQLPLPHLRQASKPKAKSETELYPD